MGGSNELIYLHTILIAVFAVTFSCILIDEDMIFGFYGKLLNRLPDKIAKPLGECAYCFGGQIAVWYYLIIEPYNPFNHVFFVSTTIFITHLTLYLYERTNR